MHMDTQIHAWEREHTRSMYVHAYGCLCAHVISDHVHTVQGVGGSGLGVCGEVPCKLGVTCTPVCVQLCACGPSNS